MTELSQARAETIEQPEADATAPLATASKPAQELLFGVQRAMFDELRIRQQRDAGSGANRDSSLR